MTLALHPLHPYNSGVTTVTETIRGQVKSRIRAGSTAREIAGSSGVDPAVLSRFLAGADAKGRNLDRLAAALGLEVRPVRRGRRQGVTRG
jgi:hypothetical protein